MGKTSPPERRELLTLLRQQPRGRANQKREQVETLIQAIERNQPADLSDPNTQQLLGGGVREVRWLVALDRLDQAFDALAVLVGPAPGVLPQQREEFPPLRGAGLSHQDAWTAWRALTVRLTSASVSTLKRLQRASGAGCPRRWSHSIRWPP